MSEPRTQQDGRHKIGEVWVDSGQVMLVDPCYLHDYGTSEYADTTENSFDYPGACAVTLGKAKDQIGEQAGQMDHGAVVSSSGYGDGSYPVYAEVKHGRVVSMTIDFDPKEDEEEDESW